MRRSSKRLGLLHIWTAGALVCAALGLGLQAARADESESGAGAASAAQTKAAMLEGPSASAPAVPENTLTDGGAVFESTDAAFDVTLPKDPAAPIELTTGAGTLGLLALDVPASIADGQLTDKENAVRYDSAGDQGTTRLVVAQPDGVETFDNIHSSVGPEDLSWRVSLTGDEELVKRDDGSVDIVDTSPNVPAAPASRPIQPSQAVVESDDDAHWPPEQTGTKVDPAAAVNSLPAAPSADALTAGSDPASVPAGAPPVPADADAARTELEQRLEGAVAEVAEDAGVSPDAIARIGDQQAKDRFRVPGEVVVATVKPPTATDSAGKDVPAELTVSGDTLTLHVEHQEGDYQYPIHADPYVWVRDLGYAWHWDPVAIRNTGWFYGTWAIQNLPNFFWGYDSYGNAMWAVNYWGTWALAYNWAWSPLYVGVPAGTPGAVVGWNLWYGYGALATSHLEWHFDPSIDCASNDLANLPDDCWAQFDDNASGLERYDQRSSSSSYFYLSSDGIAVPWPGPGGIARPGLGGITGKLTLSGTVASLLAIACARGACHSDSEDDNAAYRVRFDAQGPTVLGSNKELTETSPYVSKNPLTTSVALGLLEVLQTKLTEGQLRVRAKLFVKAAQWVKSVASVSGTRSQRGFYHRQDERIRVDINNFKGLNFRFDNWFLAV